LAKLTGACSTTCCKAAESSSVCCCSTTTPRISRNGAGTGGGRCRLQPWRQRNPRAGKPPSCEIPMTWPSC
jgi:hypothetical protein